MPPRRKPGAKLRSAAAAKTAAARAKKQAEEEKAAEEVEEVAEKEDVEDSAPVEEATSSELDNTGNDIPQEESVVAEEEANISGETPAEETPAEEDQAVTEDNEEEYTEVLEETWNEDQETNDEGHNLSEADILAEDEEGDVNQEGGEEVEEIVDQADEDILLADDNEQVEEEIEEVEEDTNPEEVEAVDNEGEAEEMEVVQVEESGDGGEETTTEGELFTIDKTPMDVEQVASKINKEKTPNKTAAKKTPAKKAQKGKNSQTNIKSNPVKKGGTKPSGADSKEKPGEQTVPLRGRVLKLSPITLSHLTNSAVAPILRASIGYVIRAKEIKRNQQQALTRSLEIWFLSEEEAEEMFVKFCNFNWKVNGRPTRVIRVNNVRETDITLKEWDQTVSPLGLYDGRCMFVSNLPSDVTKEQVLGLFPKAINIQLPTDKEGKSEGYAILEFSTRAATSEGSKMTLKLGENELKLHTVGMQKSPRTKGAQVKLDQDLRRIRQQGHSTSLSSNARSPRDQNRGRAVTRSGQQSGQRRPGQFNQRQGNQRTVQGNQRPGQTNQQNRTGQGRGNVRNQGRFSNVNNQKRGASGGRDDSSPMKRGRMDRDQRNRGMGRNQGSSQMSGGMNFRGGNREMQLRQEMMMAQQSMMAQQMSPVMSRNRQGSGGNRRSMNNEVQNIRGELLGQMQQLQQGGLSDPTYLMNLAQRLQQAQGGGGGGGFGNF